MDTIDIHCMEMNVMGILQSSQNYMPLIKWQEFSET